MRRRSLLVTALAAPALVRQVKADEGVDVALVLAVDVSRSIDESEARLQREGYRAALVDPRLLEAIRGGILGSIAVTYVEWSGVEHQRTVIPWRRIAGQADAHAWAADLAQAPRTSYGWTSISYALQYARQELAACPFEATRKVVDVSGDGPNNQGPPPARQRDLAVAEGITINGLPILDLQPVVTYGTQPQPPVDLEVHFREEVIGGPGAFLVVVDGFESFGSAVRRKLIREIAGLPGPVVVRG